MFNCLKRFDEYFFFLNYSQVYSYRNDYCFLLTEEIDICFVFLHLTSAKTLVKRIFYR